MRSGVVPNGTQVTITWNGKPLYSQVFATGEEASTYAEPERITMIENGWSGRNRLAMSTE